LPAPSGTSPKRSAPSPLPWGWLIDGNAPDRFDLIGGAVALVGIVVVLYRRVVLV